MNAQLINAAWLALQILEDMDDPYAAKGVDALRAALEPYLNGIPKQPAQDGVELCSTQSKETFDQPVAVHQFRVQGCSDWYDGHPDYSDGTEAYETRTLYTTPPQPESVIDKSAAVRIATALGWEPKRKPLTNEEIDAILKRGDVAEHDAWNGRWYVLPYQFARAIEAKLKEKNT